MRWSNFVARRLGASVLVLFGTTLVAFVLTHIVPSNPGATVLGLQATPQEIAAYNRRFGLDLPVYEQYWHYLDGLVHGNLGLSFQSGNPVIDDLKTYIPPTIELALAAMIMAGVFGVTLGTLAALRYGRPLDSSIRVLSLGGLAAPSFWLGLIAFYWLYFKLGWLPGTGQLGATLTPPRDITGAYVFDSLLTGNWADLWSSLTHLVMPAGILAIAAGAFITRVTRATVLEVLATDYVQMARAKGLSPSRVLFSYVLRAAAIPIITLSGVIFGRLLSGTVLIEAIFSWGGLGQYAYESAQVLDINAIVGVTLFVACVFIVINFVVDIVVGVIDPRVRAS